MPGYLKTSLLGVEGDEVRYLDLVQKGWENGSYEIRAQENAGYP